MADRAKHAFGALENIDAALSAGKIDAYDILFVKDADGKPYVGWIDKDGKKVIVDDSAELAALEVELATKANAEDLAEVDAKIAKKISADEVDAKIAAALDEIELDVKLDVEYEITSVPEGTLVDYRDKEIRVMCPADTKWVKQSVGATGNANMYYMGFKAYAPEGAVSFKEGDRGVIIDEMFDFNGDFAGTDEFGRNYSICWFALASYDEKSDTWTYFGKNSSINKYIGWTYVVEWYNADGVVIASDCIRINLSNEGCHSEIKPYYWSELSAELNAEISEKINEIENKIEEVSCEVVEF